MLVTELDSFVQKFYHMWHSGLDAHLDLHTHAGNAWVSLHVQLGQAHGPLHPKPVPKRVGGARLRRKEKRAAARKKAEDEKVTNESETSKEEASEEEADLGTQDNTKPNSIENLADEFCDDQVYNSDVGEPGKDEPVEELFLEPEGSITFSEDILEEKLLSLGIKPLKIEAVENESGKTNALVRIEPERKYKIEEAMFPLRVHGWKLELSQVNFTTPFISRVEV